MDEWKPNHLMQESCILSKLWGKPRNKAISIQSFKRLWNWQHQIRLELGMNVRLKTGQGENLFIGH